MTLVDLRESRLKPYISLTPFKLQSGAQFVSINIHTHHATSSISLSVEEAKALRRALGEALPEIAQ